MVMVGDCNWSQFDCLTFLGSNEAFLQLWSRGKPLPDADMGTNGGIRYFLHTRIT